MTQTQSNKNGPSVGTAAAQAAAGQTAAKPAGTNEKSAEKPADKAPAAGAAAGVDAAAGTDEQPAAKKRVSKKRVFIVVGAVHEFESLGQAEKFLNGDNSPTEEYAVLHGTRTRTSKRVSLR